MKSQVLRRVRDLLGVLERKAGDLGDVDSTLHHIATTAQTFFSATETVLFPLNPITTNQSMPAITLKDTTLQTGVTYTQPQLEVLAQQIFEQGVVLIEHLEERPEYQAVFPYSEERSSIVAMALNLKYQQRPLGILYLKLSQNQQFTPDDREVFQLFADQAAFVLQEAWLLRRYQAVVSIGEEINHEISTVDVLFEKLQKHVASLIDINSALLLAVYQPQSNTLDLYLEEQTCSLIRLNEPLEGACQHVIETQEVLKVEYLSKQAEEIPFKRSEIEGTDAKESLIFVPLIQRDVTLGVLSVQHPQAYAFQPEDLFILQLLANYVALALHNIRLFISLNRLNEAGQLLTLQLDSAQVLQSTANTIRDAADADIVVLYPYETALQRFVLPPRIAGRLLDEAFPLPTYLPPNVLPTLSLQQSSPIFAKEAQSIPDFLEDSVSVKSGSFQEREKICSTAVVPLRVGDEAVGVLFVNFRQPQRFAATQKLFIEGLAHYAAIAIKNAQAFGSLSSRRVRELEILQKIDRELSSTLELETILNTLLKLACEHVPAEEASILLYDVRANVLKTRAAIGPHATASLSLTLSLQELQGITRWVFEEKTPARVDNVYRDEKWRDLYVPVVTGVLSELDVPLIDDGQVIGILNFESMREAAFSQEDQDFLLTLSGQAVLAIKNARAYDREKRLVEEAQVIDQISREIVSQLDRDHVFNLILEKALALTKSSHGNLMIYDAEQDDLWMAAERGVIKEGTGVLRQSLQDGIVGQVARTKEALNVDLSQLPWRDLNLNLIPGARSELAVPMLVGEDLQGVLNIESFSENYFTVRDERLLKALADLAMIALHNARAYEREKRLLEEAQVLNQISREIVSQLDMDHVFNLILKNALKLTHSTLGSLHLYDPERNDLWVVVERGVVDEKQGLRQKLGEGVLGWAAQQRKLVNVPDVSKPPWNELYIDVIPGIRSELAIPMLEGGQLRGVLNVESLAPGHFNNEIERLLQGLADLAVVALQNAEHYEKAEDAAQRFELLYQAGQELSKITYQTQLEQAYDIILNIVEKYRPCQVVIRQYAVETQKLIAARASRYQHFPPFPQMDLEEGLNGQVARERRTIMISDTHNLPPGVVVKLSDAHMHSLVIVPIKFKEQYYGNLALGHREIAYFRGSDVNFFEGLADQLASTIYRLETAHARQEFEQRAQAAEEMSSIGQSAFEVTHRLGNDLGLVDYYLRNVRTALAKLNVVDRVVSKNLDKIEVSVQKVLSFSRDLKQELAKLGEEQAVSEPVVIAPRDLFERVIVGSAIPAIVRIEINVDDDIADVEIVYGRVDAILHNLVANAIHAMPKGGTITLRARNSGRAVVLEVIDTGVGIPEEKVSKIFELFFSTKGSSGFGLWSARHIALKNRGDLRVKSKPGQGTIFMLFLPKVGGGML